MNELKAKHNEIHNKSAKMKYDEIISNWKYSNRWEVIRYIERIENVLMKLGNLMRFSWCRTE